MAEFVEQMIQDMIPEVEDLERMELLTSSEIKKLIQKRRSFEYQISKRRKEKQNFVNYVLFDIKLIDLISLRRQKLSLFKNQNRIENAMSRRVSKRLRLMSRLWPSHPDIWRLRISFARSRKFFEEVSTSYLEQVRYHGNDENLWVAWAQWEMEGRMNFDKARNILLSKAPLYHPKSLLLSKEYFRLELLFIEFLKKKSERSNLEGLEEITAENREKVLNCGIPETVYETASEDFDTNPDFFLEFYSVARLFPFAGRLTGRIYCDLVQKFPSDLNVWRLKGRLMMEGVKVAVEGGEKGGGEGEEDKKDKEEEEEEEKDKEEEEEEEEGKSSEEEESPRTPKGRLRSLFSLYDEALSSAGPSFVTPLAQDLFKLLHDSWGAEEFVGTIARKIDSVFHEHSESLSPEQFLIWFEVACLLKQSPEELSMVLDKARVAAPSCLQVRLASHRLGFQSGDYLNNKDKLEMMETLSGEIGADICESLIESSDKKGPLWKKACNHTDAALSKAMRIKKLESFKGLEKSRAHYKLYCSLPPFNTELHFSMLRKELKRKKVSLPHVRQVFEVAIHQFGWEQPELWLCYLELERKRGEAKKVLTINREIELKLNPERMNHFIDYKFAIETSLSKRMEADQPKQVFVDCPDKESDNVAFEFWRSSSLPPLFEAEPTLMHSAFQEKERFFHSLADIVKAVKEEAKPSVLKVEKEDTKHYEEILGLIHGGESVSLRVKKVTLDTVGVEREAQGFVERTERDFAEARKKRKESLSSKLQYATMSSKKSFSVSDEMSKILKSSKTLESGFLQQKQIIPYYLSKKYIQSLKKKVSESTAGKGWFNMKAPELTEEVQRDLKVLRMRSILDPQRHYKRNDMREVPKFFQMGKVIDSPLDFYSSRVPKRERKANMAEEIINDEEVLRFQKRKYSEILEKKESKKRKVMKVKNNIRKSKSKGKRKATKMAKE